MDKDVKANEASEVETKTVRRKKRKLRNLDTVKNEAPLSQSSKKINVEESDVIEEGNKELQKTKTKKSKTSKGSESTLTTNKKIKFDYDDSGEVLKKPNKPKKKKFNDEEAEIKDEDIDKYCEEIDEEDNKQYENWVKLFETNFRSKKKNT